MSLFDRGERPVLTLLTSHWLTMAGALLVSVAGCAWLLTLPIHVRGHAANPYIGILSFVILPILFVAGLLLMPVGLWISKREIRQGMRTVLTRKATVKRLATFLIIATALNVVIVS